MNRYIEALLFIFLFISFASIVEFLALRKDVEPDRRLALLGKLLAANVCLAPLYVIMFAVAMIVFLISGDFFDDFNHKAFEALVFCATCLVFPALMLIAGRFSRRRLKVWLRKRDTVSGSRLARVLGTRYAPILPSTLVLLAIYLARQIDHPQKQVV